MRVRAILFDLDGTLVEPSIDFEHMREVVLGIVVRYGMAPEPFRTMHVLELVASVRSRLEVTDGDAAGRFVAETARAILDIELEAAGRVSPYAGVSEMLATLKRRGYAIGIVTRNCRAAVERILGRVPLMHDVLLTRDDVPEVKPNPRHLLAALCKLGVAGQDALMCGDHVMDVIAGRRAGTKTAGILRPGVPPDYFEEVQPDLVLKQVTDLLAALDKH